MARARGLTVKAVENLEAKAERYEVPDPGCAGLYLQVHPSGAKSWAYRYRFAGKSRKLTLGTAYTDAGVEVIKIGDARDLADEARVAVAKRVDPAEVKKAERKKAAADDTLRSVAKVYLAQHKSLRTIGTREAVLKRLVFPVLGDRAMESIKRSEVVKLLDDIEQSRGPVMSDYTLATMRRLFSWHAVRTDDFVSPIMRGMARTSTKDRARKRVLSDIELRALWRAANEAGLFGQYLQLLLLTATRRNEAAGLRRSEMELGDWTVPAARYKTKVDHLVPLSEAAIGIIARVMKVGKGDLVFTLDGQAPLRGWGSRKAAFDCLMLTQLRQIVGEDVRLERWTLHDLRRTARTLMSRAGVLSDHAELCLGHVIGGVEGTYDRYAYVKEKREAFAKLADLIATIVEQPLGKASETPLPRP
ncbi:site-specific integrase [Bradyrhizobium sp. BR 10261]|uniref:tyrosine-type recombinase/integrase n=1 Tax=Bradyrhizobium sp. BR 10261 TaxID=2749992 RepID=UPI001C65391D|nr:site-specific integrase [Bradyrhizobium sp. BR 10261]MBW7964947.1 integrase arm-type DNA-binding domain-containing protein [Bradyrhizobium sp. BR 10261]